MLGEFVVDALFRGLYEVEGEGNAPLTYLFTNQTDDSGW
jgi:hypothetical protein